MLSAEELQRSWLLLQSKLTHKSGRENSIEDILLLIGKQESGWPPQKQISEKDKTDLLQLAICSILLPARYFELIWVDDIGWPHFKQLQKLPDNNSTERTILLKEYILFYNNKIQLEKLLPDNGII